ncbi:hypothetical protein BJ912DRAFT_934013 [Pholiota molesta]|nr:hypothetical protein BJ912DRAFT_934013 [Pholiota molesta]
MVEGSGTDHVTDRLGFYRNVGSYGLPRSIDNIFHLTHMSRILISLRDRPLCAPVNTPCKGLFTHSVKNAELTLRSSQSNRMGRGVSMPPSGMAVGRLLDDDEAVGSVGCSDGEDDDDGEDVDDDDAVFQCGGGGGGGGGEVLEGTVVSLSSPDDDDGIPLLEEFGCDELSPIRAESESPLVAAKEASIIQRISCKSCPSAQNSDGAESRRVFSTASSRLAMIAASISSSNSDGPAGESAGRSDNEEGERQDDGDEELMAEDDEETNADGEDDDVDADGAGAVAEKKANFPKSRGADSVAECVV